LTADCIKKKSLALLPAVPISLGISAVRCGYWTATEHFACSHRGGIDPHQI